MEILLFKQKAFKQLTLSLGGCHRNLWQHQETGQALFRCYPCMASNSRLLPPSRLYDYKKLCKAKQLLLNGCRSAEWMQSGSCHSKVRRCLSAGSKESSVSRRSIPNIPNYLQAWLLQWSIIPHSHHFVLIRRVRQKGAHLLKSRSSMPSKRRGLLLFCRIINVSNLIVAAKHASPHCNREVSEEEREKKDGRRGHYQTGSQSCSLMSLFCPGVSMQSKPSQARIQTSRTWGWRWPVTFFWAQPYRFSLWCYLHQPYPTAAAHSGYKWSYASCWKAQSRQRDRCSR